MHDNSPLNTLIPSVLIANRGEIACRIMRTAKRLGIRTIAVYSDIDQGALHVTMADEAVCIGQAEAKHSYINIDAIITAALATKAHAIHPGYGFLSERPEFVDACASNNLIFIGPPASAMRAMGLKDEAKARAVALNIPVIAGYYGVDQALATLTHHAQSIGFPLLIKAVSGGGGKGMKRVDALHEFEQALASAQREAQAAFGDSRVLLEQYLTTPRHIEIQIFADGHGNCVHLFERDCSMQRRHQKVIEEAPAPHMPQALREKMAQCAISLAKSVGYVGAGTVEFLVDGSRALDENNFFFLEMNTRLQVEHPVTEMITGVDLVEWQLRIAAGQHLPLAQHQMTQSGHAIEARLYAEDVVGGFLPSTGTIKAHEFPSHEGIRVETGVRTGDAIHPFYDPMLAKIIAYGENRNIALQRLSCALEHTWMMGITTNAPFLKSLVDSPAFENSACDTGFIMKHLDELIAQSQPNFAKAACFGAIALLFQKQETQRPSLWQTHDAFQLAPMREQSLNIRIDDAHNSDVKAVTLSWCYANHDVAHTHVVMRVQCDNERIELDAHDPLDALKHVPIVRHQGCVDVILNSQPLRVTYAIKRSQNDGAQTSGHIISPMHGKITAIDVEINQNVEKGARLLVVEAMKMEHIITAPHAGKVTKCDIKIGDQLSRGDVCLVIEG